MDLPDLEATLLAVRPATHAMKSSFSYSSGYQGDHHVSFSVISFDYCYQPPPERDARSLNATTSEGWSIGSHSNIFKFLPRDIGLARSQPIADRHGVETRNRDMVLVQSVQEERHHMCSVYPCTSTCRKGEAPDGPLVRERPCPRPRHTTEAPQGLM